MSKLQVLSILDSNDNELYCQEIDSDTLNYIKDNPGHIIMFGDKIFCFFKKNIDIGRIVDFIMKDLRRRKIRESKLSVYPINYYIQDYVDFNHDSGLILVEIINNETS